MTGKVGNRLSDKRNKRKSSASARHLPLEIVRPAIKRVPQKE